MEGSKKIITLEGSLNSGNLEFEIDPNMEGWAIVNEMGVGRWLGRVANHDKVTHRMTLQLAFELSSPSRAPVIAIHPGQGQVEGVVSGFNCDFVLRQNSTHPVEDIAVSSVQWLEKSGEELRLYCFNIIADVVLGPIDPRTNKRHKA